MDGTPPLEAGPLPKGARPRGVSLHRRPAAAGLRGCADDRGAPIRPDPAQPHAPIWPGAPGLRAALSPHRTGSEPGASPASSVSVGPAESGSIRQPRGLRALPPALGRISRGRRRERSPGSLAAPSSSPSSPSPSAPPQGRAVAGGAAALPPPLGAGGRAERRRGHGGGRVRG